MALVAVGGGGVISGLAEKGRTGEGTYEATHLSWAQRYGNDVASTVGEGGPRTDTISASDIAFCAPGTRRRMGRLSTERCFCGDLANARCLPVGSQAAVRPAAGEVACRRPHVRATACLASRRKSGHGLDRRRYRPPPLEPALVPIRPRARPCAVQQL